MRLIGIQKSENLQHHITSGSFSIHIFSRRIENHYSDAYHTAILAL